MKKINRRPNIDRGIAFIFICFLISCGGSKKTQPYESEIDVDPKIIFLSYSISRDENDKKSIQFLNQKTVEGKIKIKSSESVNNGVEGDLICSQLNKKSKTVNTSLVKNPLFKTIEFVDDSKNFQTKTINTNKTQFSVRLQLNSSTKYITISNFADKATLIKTKIN